MTSTQRAWLANGLLATFSSVVGLALVEGVLRLALSYPQIFAPPDGRVSRPLAILRDLYLHYDRPVLIVLPECARYDPDVSYTLKPGMPEDREHRVEYAANRAGLRDDDQGLEHPSIVVVGDSQAMGFGVEASQSFAEVLQHDLGLNVLNAGIASYGTARELRLLERLALPDFPVLVIQYDDNDFNENKRLVERGALDILSETEWWKRVQEHARDTRYYLFKHTRNLLYRARHARPWATPPPPADTNAEEARIFLEALLRYAAIIRGKTVVVVEVNDGYNLNDWRFTAAVAELLKQPRYADLAPWVGVLDISGSIRPSDYFVLDGHMRPSGHAKVARLIEDELRRRGALKR